MPNLGNLQILRQKALRIADSGDHGSWVDVAHQMELEGIADAVRKLSGDREFLEVLNERCARAALRRD